MRTAQFVSPVMTLALGAVLVGAPRTDTAAPDALPEELWIEPSDLEQRDLLRGPGDSPTPPSPNGAFAFVKKDTSGRSPGYDVRDANGIVWSVKLGPEAQPEVVASHLLWSIGFHQPPTFYLNQWTLTGEGEGTGPQQGGRFRPEDPGWKVTRDWKWDEGPLAHTRAMKGLLVAMMMINNWERPEQATREQHRSRRCAMDGDVDVPVVRPAVAGCLPRGRLFPGRRQPVHRQVEREDRNRTRVEAGLALK
jgi:hypothetical protein